MSDGNIRVLHFSSHDEDCGVGKYQEQFLIGMSDIPGVHNEFFEISPYQTRIMNPAQFEQALAQMAQTLQNFDILHIQHEFSFFHDNEFAKIVEMAKGLGKKVVVTLHLSPSFAIKSVKLGGLGPRSLIHYARQRKHLAWKMRNHIVPFRQADLILVHNEVTKQSLVSFGVEENHIQKLIHPVYEVPSPPVSTEIATKLHKKEGDVIFCVTGFLHRYKGILGAVRALKFLPANYKLVLVGGVKADSDEVVFQDKVTDLIDILGLHDRVYITGFVPDDDRMNALIRECDVCVYPYDRLYYASLSSGSLSLAFANSKPVIAYPTASFKEAAALVPDALLLCSTFAYYELARELQRIDIAKGIKGSREYAQKMAWPKSAKLLAEIYSQLMQQ